MKIRNAFLVVLLLLIVSCDRYELVEGQGASVYRLDKWTGELDLCALKGKERHRTGEVAGFICYINLYEEVDVSVDP